MNDKEYNKIIELGKVEILFQITKIVLAIYFVVISLIGLGLLRKIVLFLANL